MSETDGSSPDGASPDPFVYVDGPLRIIPAGGGGLDALLVGELELVGGCAAVRSPAGLSFVVVWPEGTRWDAENSAVVLHGGTRVAVGEEISLEGGGMTAAEVSRIQPGGPEVAASLSDCVKPDDTIWYAGRSQP